MVEIVVNNELTISGKLPENTEAFLREALTFPNPEYELAERQRRSTYNISPMLSFFKKKSGIIYIPRGFSAQALHILRSHNIDYQVKEDTRIINDVDFSFSGKLYPFQKTAIKNIVKRRFGVLNSPTGSGKTVMALATVAERKQPTLIICHTKELLYQWRDRAMEFLQLNEDDIGLIGDGKCITDKQFTVAIINSLYKCVDEMKNKIGYLIVDECHRVPSRTFTDAIRCFDSRYMLGLSATAYRRDNLTKLIYLYMGDRVHSIDPKELQKNNKIMVAKLRIRQTEFDSFISGSSDYQELIEELVNNKDRNDFIIEDVIAEAKNKKGICLVLSDRKQHCQKLYEEILRRSGMSVALLTGDTNTSLRKQIVSELEQSQIDILVASGRLIGEGFDCPKLSSLFLATPVKFSGRITQYLGRILRVHQNKTEPTIYDYVDRPGVLRSSFKSRCYAYQKMGVILDDEANH